MSHTAQGGGNNLASKRHSCNLAVNSIFLLSLTLSLFNTSLPLFFFVRPAGSVPTDAIVHHFRWTHSHSHSFQQQHLPYDSKRINMPQGVRADPKFLRDPTSLEYLSSGLTKMSLYLASNLQKKRSSAPAILHDAQQDWQSVESEEMDPHDDTEWVTFTSFENAASNSLLLLGYQDGFQVWDVTNPENVHETCSLRDQAIGTVRFMHILADPHTGCVDEFAQQRPLLAILSSAGDDSSERQHEDSMPCKPMQLRIFSLHTHQLIKEFSDLIDQGVSVRRIQSNAHSIVLGTTTEDRGASLHILSAFDLSQQSNPLTDVYHHPTLGPVFALGTRFIAYATTTADTDRLATGFLPHVVSEKDVKGVAKDIAKEVHGVVKSLSEYSYHTISNYFANNPPAPAPEMSSSPTRRRRRSSASSSSIDASQPVGLIMIRELQKLPSIYAHFRSHHHTVTNLTFNPSGTLLLSASNQGHTFYIFSLVSGEQPVTHIYTLSRGITDALVEDVRFSTDSLWCAVSTARGTTHLYAINPYGGSAEIPGHVQAKVINPKYHPYPTDHRRVSFQQATTLNSVMRIKQRRIMPGTDNPKSGNLATEEPSNSRMRIPSNSSIESVSVSRGAKLATHFLPVSKTPYLLIGTIPEAARQASASSWKAQASNLLQNSKNMVDRWTSDRDNRMFGFDEEEDRNVADREPLSTGYRDIYSVHPRGILTLHRCWLVQTLVKKRESGRVVEKLEMNVKQGDVAEWEVSRKPDWDQVKAQQNDDMSTKKRTKGWLSFAEISTCEYEKQLWMDQHFSFHTYEPPSDEDAFVPQARPLILTQDAPEPYASRIDRVGRTAAAKDGALLDDALAELEENISNAMKSSFSPSPSGFLSTSANSATRFSFSTLDRLSFEDACLINMGNKISNGETSSTDDSASRMDEEVYSPDGDNEIASPHDSVFGDDNDLLKP
ncbi:hypothetical protein BJV82DRAFT_713945 [Fennellomyces sp. T-0311]|nr:hypothetical protein BJV82DRAFT_713945 [Fennellomyces sp. T-0311]